MVFSWSLYIFRSAQQEVYLNKSCDSEHQEVGYMLIRMQCLALACKWDSVICKRFPLANHTGQHVWCREDSVCENLKWKTLMMMVRGWQLCRYPIFNQDIGLCFCAHEQHFLFVCLFFLIYVLLTSIATTKIWFS